MKLIVPIKHFREILFQIFVTIELLAGLSQGSFLNIKYYAFIKKDLLCEWLSKWISIFGRISPSYFSHWSHWQQVFNYSWSPSVCSLTPISLKSSSKPLILSFLWISRWLFFYISSWTNNFSTFKKRTKIENLFRTK